MDGVSWRLRVQQTKATVGQELSVNMIWSIVVNTARRNEAIAPIMPCNGVDEINSG